MTQKHLFLKIGLIIGEMGKRYDEFTHILWKKPASHFKYPADLHQQVSKQNSVLQIETFKQIIIAKMILQSNIGFFWIVAAP